ncbi:MAG: ABC transporter substrate-binding protein [Acidimicrobiia bacterium]
MRSHVRLLASVALLAMLGTACSDMSPSGTMPILAAVAQASTGGRLDVGIVRPGSIHPTLASSPGGMLASSLMCDTLVHIDPETGAAVPNLAESWVVSQFAITFKLRRGVLMHDGKEMTARDVFFAAHRLVDPQEGSYHTKLLDGVVGYGQFTGEELEEGESRPSRMAGVQVLERYGIQFRIAGADPNFLRAFAHPALAPISESAYEANPLAFARDPVCAGPYRLAQPYDPAAERFALVRDDAFTETSSGITAGGLGYVDEITFHTFADPGAVIAAYQAGTVDVAKVPNERVGELTAAYPGDVVEGIGPHVEYVGLPVTGLAGVLGIEVGPRERFDDLAARQVLSLALDRQAIAAALHDGTRLPADGFAPPSAGSYAVRPEGTQSRMDFSALPKTSGQAIEQVEAGTSFCGDLLPATGDAAGARRLLDEVVVQGPDGPRPVTLEGASVPFYYNDEFGNAAFVEAVAASWQRSLGLEVRPVQLSWEQFLDIATSGAGFDGFFRLSWASPDLNPEDYLRALVEPTGPANFTGFSDETITTLLAELRNYALDDHRVELGQLEDVLCALLPVVPVTFTSARWLARTAEWGTARPEVVGPDGQILLRELYTRG